MISIAKYCKDMCNFNSAFAINSGFFNHWVKNLKAVWKEVDKDASTKKIRMAIESFCDSSHNFTRTRKAQQEAQENEEPYVPVLAVCLKDICALESTIRLNDRQKLNCENFKDLANVMNHFPLTKEFKFRPVLFIQNWLLHYEDPDDKKLEVYSRMADYYYKAQS